MAISSSRRHEVQDLFVGLAFHGNTVNAQELVSCAEPTILLRCAQRNDGPDVDLIR